MPARITLDAFRDRIFAGTVSRVADYVLDREKQARTVEIEVRFDTPQDTADLLAGYSADAEIILQKKENVVRLPSEAVINGATVFLYDNGILRQRRITTGLANWQYTEVTAGLAPGDLVVTSVDRKGLGDGVRATISEK